MSNLSYRHTTRFTAENVRYIASRARDGEDFSSTLRRVIQEHQAWGDMKLDQMILEQTMKHRLDKMTKGMEGFGEVMVELIERVNTLSEGVLMLAEATEPEQKKGR
jgi:predicted CopG family antitoxin